MILDRKTGESITIVERRTDGVAGARRSTCLIFSTDAGFTRIWNYPERWQELSDDELVALLDQLHDARSA